MTEVYDWKPPTHLDASREAWHDFKEAVGFEAFTIGDDEDGPNLPAPIAWLCAPWRPLGYRFSRYNLERLLRPQKAERRQRLDGMHQYVFWCGASGMTAEDWAEVDALVAEFGGDFPPRDWEPMSVSEAVGSTLGFTREEVAEITARA